MAKKRSALERVRNNPKNTSPKDLIELLEDFGFKCRNVCGDHYIYKKTGHGTFPIPIKQNPVAFFIVKEILREIASIEEQTSN